MFKNLSGRLSAPSSLDGKHLRRYLDKSNYIKKTLCEELILHDNIVIPTQDYLTACGLALILGEKTLLTLLDQKKITIARTQGMFGFVRGSEREGALITFGDPAKKRPQCSDIESSVDKALLGISERLHEKKKLRDLLIQNSTNIELSKILSSIKQDTYNDFKNTSLWKPTFELENIECLDLPGMKKMQTRVVGPGAKPNKDPVDALLALTRYNIELYLSQEFSCNTTSTGSPMGDLIRIKASKFINNDKVVSTNLWSLLEVNKVPDFGRSNFIETSNFDSFIKVCTSRNADEFRKWFHENKNLQEKEILREYIGLLREVPWTKKLPLKSLRFVIATGLGFVPVLGQVASFIDTFFIDKVLKKSSPVFFIDDLKDFYGKILTKQTVSNRKPI